MRTGLLANPSRLRPSPSVAIPELFRARFQRSLRNCVRRRFSVAECFGVIWLETLEEVPLTEGQQAELYDELIHWAKHTLFREVIDRYSLTLFTDRCTETHGAPGKSAQGRS